MAINKGNTMILTDVKDLKKDKSYCLYDNSGNMKMVLIIQTSGDVVDNYADITGDQPFPGIRYEIDGRCLGEYISELKVDFNGDDRLESIELTVNDPDNYTDGFEFLDNDSAMLWELTDVEVAVHTINHI